MIQIIIFCWLFGVALVLTGILLCYVLVKLCDKAFLFFKWLREMEELEKEEDEGWL